jgi:hypothetical protein
VGVGGGEEAVAGNEHRAALPPARPAGRALHIEEGFGDGGAVGLHHLAGDRMAAERPGQRDRLRRRQGQVEAGDRLAPRRRLQPERLTVERVLSDQHRVELGGLDLAGEIEVGSSLAEPVALGLALARVVILGGFGDLSV